MTKINVQIIMYGVFLAALGKLSDEGKDRLLCKLLQKKKKKKGSVNRGKDF